MTGFGRARGQLGSLAIEVELTSLNRKHLEVQASLPREWVVLEVDMLRILRQSLVRGRVQVLVRATAAASEESNEVPAWMRARLESLRQWSLELGVAFSPGAGLLAEWMREETESPCLPLVDDCREVVLGLLREAGQALSIMRLAEGTRLAADLGERLERLRERVAGMEKAARGSVRDYRDALHGRLRELDLSLDSNDERLMKELAIFADRVDVSEELTRLAGHLQQFAESLAEGGAVGRKLEFLIQEMQRELNTLTAKSYRPEAKKLGLEARSILEQIREQVANVE